MLRGTDHQFDKGIMIDMELQYSACITGHRPEKLVRQQFAQRAADAAAKRHLYQMIGDAAGQGYRHFYIGMARGVDLYAGEIVLHLKRFYPQLTLTGVLPFPGHDRKWSQDWRQRHQAVLSQCDQVKIVSEQYCDGCYQQRNEYMVDHSALVIAVWNGCKSGTANTIQYARLMGKEVRCARIDLAQIG